MEIKDEGRRVPAPKQQTTPSATDHSAAASPEFSEIAHSGGKITFGIKVDPDGGKQYNVRFTFSRPVPASLFGIYASVRISRSTLSCLLRPKASSDSEGYFGHQCSECGKYWRSRTQVRICPYCGVRGGAFQFLTQAHLSYVKHYAHTLLEALSAAQSDQSVTIDLDATSSMEPMTSPSPNFTIPAQAIRRALPAYAVRQPMISVADTDFARTAAGEITLQIFERRSKPFERTSTRSILSPQKPSKRSFLCLMPAAVIGRLSLLLCRCDRVVARSCWRPYSTAWTQQM